MKLVKLQGADGDLYVNPERVVSVYKALTPPHVLAKQRELGIPPVDNGCVYVVITPTETYVAIGDVASVLRQLSGESNGWGEAP